MEIFIELCKYRNCYFIKPAANKAFKESFKFNLKSTYKKIIAAVATALFHAFTFQEFYKMEALGMKIAEIVTIAIILWLLLSFFEFVGRFIFNLFKIQVDTANVIQDSQKCEQIIDEISRLQIESDNLVIDNLEDWEKRSIEVINKIPCSNNSYYLSFVGEDISNVIIAHYLEYLKLKNGGNLQRMPHPFKLSSKPMENIEFKAFGCLGLIKAKILPYTIPKFK